MKEVVIPADGVSQKKKGTALARRRKAFGVWSFGFAVLAILTLIGALVCLILTEVGAEKNQTLFYILSGALVGGTVLFAVVAALVSTLMQSAYQTELDYRERCDSENSFFVGDGTLATFEDASLRIHAEDGEGEEIVVPYSEMRFFSVCTRHAPREKGEWSVVIEVPAKYLAKAGQVEGNGPALIQADAKERLYRRLEELGLTVSGEREKKEKSKKFQSVQKYVFPDREGRKRALIQIVLGVVFCGAGIGVAFLQAAFGAILIVFGAFILGRAINTYFSKKSVLAFYAEGVYWKEERKSDSVFLKWEEIESISQEEKKGIPLLKVNCAYGAFHFLNCEGAFEFIQQNHPEKCVE